MTLSGVRVCRAKATMQSSKKGTGFGVRAGWDACTLRAAAFGQVTLRVHRGRTPTPGRVGHRWKGRHPSLVLVRGRGLQCLPASMSMVGMRHLFVVLWFQWYPASRPQGILVMVSDALSPLCWHDLICGPFHGATGIAK